jgi:hypothetical protein
MWYKVIMKTIIILSIMFSAALSFFLFYSLRFNGAMCGGIAANLNTCPVGYACVYKNHHPDASGTCVFSPMHFLLK